MRDPKLLQEHPAVDQLMIDAAKPVLVAGQVFNPYRVVKRNLLIPESVARHPRLSHGAKLTYGWLRGYAGENGVCWLGQDRLAKELGCSYRQARRYLDELEAERLIDPDRNARPGSTPVYRFLSHPMLEPDVQGGLDMDGQGGLDMGGHRSGSCDQGSDIDSLAQKHPLRQVASHSARTDEENSNTPEADVSHIRKTITELMEREPDDDIVRQVLEAGGGAPVTEIVEYIRQRCERYRPYTAKGPRKMAWFVAVVRSEFGRRRAQQQADHRSCSWREHPVKVDPGFEATLVEALGLPADDGI